MCPLYLAPLHLHNSSRVLQNGSDCKVAERNMQGNLFLEGDNIRTLSNKINRPSCEQNRDTIECKGESKFLKKKKKKIRSTFEVPCTVLLQGLTYAANKYSSDRKIHEKNQERFYVLNTTMPGFTISKTV